MHEMSLCEGIRRVVDRAGRIVGHVTDGIGRVVGHIANGISRVIGGVGNGIRNVVGGIGRRIGSAGSSTFGVRRVVTAATGHEARQRQHDRCTGSRFYELAAGFVRALFVFAHEFSFG